MIYDHFFKYFGDLTTLLCYKFNINGLGLCYFCREILKLLDQLIFVA